ncbi:MAG: MAPEG family protein [Alphaproteobacteria bacterium]
MTVTITYAGLLALIYAVLFVQVVRLRQSLKVGIGDGGHDELARAIRVHANFAENVPVLLILMVLIEGHGAPVWAMHVLGVALVLCRVLHAWGLRGSAGPSVGRLVGATGTLILLIVCGIWAAVLGLSGLL